MRTYPATLTPEPGGGFTVTFRDVPEAITCGADRTEALSMARDALETALSFYVERGIALPIASPVSDVDEAVDLSPGGDAKATLYEVMRGRGLGAADLAARLGWPVSRAIRVLDFCRPTARRQIETALAAIGTDVTAGRRDAA